MTTITPDPIKNFAYSTVATAPSPATSGLSLVLASGDGALFPQPSTDGAFNLVICPVGTQPTSANAEIVRCTARVTDTLTIVRQQEGTSARTVIVGDQVFAAVTAKTFADTIGALGQRFTSGQYYGGLGQLSTSLPGEGAVFAWPFVVGEDTTFDRIGVEITVAGTVGAVSRLGIYADNGKCRPGALALDAGTVSGTAAAGVEATISQLLKRGIYWLSCTTQGGAGTRPTYRVNSGSAPFVPVSPGASTITGATATGGGGVNSNTAVAAGALPDPFPTITATSSAPRVVLRAA